MTGSNEVEKLSLNKQIVVAVIELIDFYSKKGVFKVNEYKDISTINERLTEVATALEANKDYDELTAQELGFVLLIFKEGTQRIPTAIESFGQLFGIFQHYKTLLEQAVAKDEESKKDVPRVEQLE
jgi:hypothetical protein